METFKLIFGRLEIYPRLLLAFVIPFFLVYQSLTMGGKALMRQLKPEAPKYYRVAILGADSSNLITQSLVKNPRLKLQHGLPEADIDSLIQNEHIDAVLTLPAGVDSLVASKKNFVVGLKYDFFFNQALGTAIQRDLEKISIQAFHDTIQLKADNNHIATAFTVQAAPSTNMMKALGDAVNMMLKVLAALIAYLVVFFSLWNSKHVAIYAFVQHKAQGHFFPKFVGLAAVSILSVMLAIFGIKYGVTASSNDETAMLVGMLNNFLTNSAYTSVLAAAIFFSIFAVSIWAFLGQRYTDAYRMTRFGSILYVLIFILFNIGVLLFAVKNSAVNYIPIANLLPIFDSILQNTFTIGQFSIFVGINLALTAALLLSAKGNKVEVKQ